jgi:hypothetical protein
MKQESIKSMISIVDAFNIPKRSIILLSNKNTSKFFIAWSNNTLKYVMKTILLLDEGLHPNRELQKDKDDLELYFIKINENTHNAFIIYRANMMCQGIQHYMYNKIKHIDFTPKVIVQPYGTTYTISVILITNRHERFLVRSGFDLVTEAQEYIKNNTLDSMIKEAELRHCTRVGVSTQP